MSNDAPLWTPSDNRRDRANLHRFVRFVREATGNDDIGSYAPLYEFSVRNPAKFWALVWEFCGIRATGEFEPALVDGDRMPGAPGSPTYNSTLRRTCCASRMTSPP